MQGKVRLLHSRKRIPRSFRRHPACKKLLHEADISLSRKSRLRAKVLIFESPRALRAFWREAIGSDLGKHCLGAVNGLLRHVIRFDSAGREKKWIEADARYFCVIGLTRGNLDAEIVTHEAVHAGFCYTKRVRRNHWSDKAKEFDEEGIAYPAGLAAARLNELYWKLKRAGILT